jgi:hypothetical protein
VATGTGAPALRALKRGDIAGWMSWDTAVDELENRGMEFTEFRPSTFDNQFGNAVVTREDLIRDNPKLVDAATRKVPPRRLAALGFGRDDDIFRPNANALAASRRRRARRAATE